MNIRICGTKDKPVGFDVHIINTTSHSPNWSYGLSPFILGPCDLYFDMKSKNVENGWQFSKVYKEINGVSHVDENGDPNSYYFDWAITGWEDNKTHRYPAGRNAVPLYSFWDGEKLDYIQARKKIYIPLYYKSVKNTNAYKKLKEYAESVDEIWLWCFDGYDHKKLGLNYKDVINNPKKKMGHSFILGMMLDGLDLSEKSEILK